MMTTKLSSITKRAGGKPKEQFTSLARLLTEDFLKQCFRELKRDKAFGVDGVKIYHNLYTLSSYLGRITEEPNVGNPQVRFCERH